MRVVKISYSRKFRAMNTRMIDFDETVYSSYIFDLSTSLAYIMMENLSPAGYPGPVEFIAPLFNGFTSVFPLSSEEKQNYLTLARCCKSAVFSGSRLTHGTSTCLLLREKVGS